MQNKIQMTPVQTPSSLPERTPEAQPVDRADRLVDLLSEVRRDSVKGSSEYLDETHVPHGGE